MDPKLIGLGLSLLKNMMGSGNSESTRALIQEELRKSQNQENRDMLQQMLSVLEQKHAADLQEVNLEKEKYKFEAEFLRKELEEARKEKKSAERTDKMKEILNHLSALSLQKDETTFKKKDSQKVFSSKPCSSQSNSSGSTLPWMDSPKGNNQSAPRGGGHRGKGNYHSNFSSHPKSQQNHNFQKNTNLQQKQFQQPPLIPNPPSLIPNSHFQQPQQFIPNHNFHLNQNMQPNVHPNQGFLPNYNVPQNTNFQSNPNFQPQQHFMQNNNVPNNGAFQQNPNFQPRGQNKYRGRGQRGNSGRGRGRSSSVGRDQAQMNQTSDDTVPSSSFHIQVTKVGQKWVSSENIAHPPNASSQRGRGNSRGRGRGRGAGNNLQGTDGSQAGVKKNRRKNQQTEYAGNRKQHYPRNKQKNDEEDPEDNCVIS